MLKKKETKQFKSKKQFLFRFLKEKKIFSSSYLIRLNRRGTLNRIEYDFFDASLSWRSTIEGHPFWLKIQCEFILFIINYDNDKLFNRDSLLSYFHDIIYNEYFSENSLTKDSEYYKYICKEYEKFNKSLK